MNFNYAESSSYPTTHQPFFARFGVSQGSRDNGADLVRSHWIQIQFGVV